MIKPPIGILDMGIDNISIVNSLALDFKFESFIYINDLECPQYEGLTIEHIQARVQKNVEILINQGVKLIIVVSNTIVEYCREYFDTITVPVINIVDTIIDYVNEKFEHRNLIFLASDNALKANIYQKNFRYNHLYNIISDKLDNIIINNQLKTNESFSTTHELFKVVFKKEVDVIIPTTFNHMLLTTEINEFMKDCELISLSKVFNEKIKAALLANENLNLKGRGKIAIYINVPHKKVNFAPLLQVKVQVVEVNRLKLANMLKS